MPKSSEKTDKRLDNDSHDFFYLLSINNTFKKDLANFRKKYHIETAGYDFNPSSEEVLGNFINLVSRNAETHDKDIHTLAKKYQVPANLMLHFKLFLILNQDSPIVQDNMNRLPEKNFAIDFSDDNSQTEEEWKISGRPYIKILISENWSLFGVKTFLIKNEKVIKKFFATHGQLPKRRSRKLSKLERDEIIWKLWQLPLEELRLMSKQEKYRIKYKQDAISFILKDTNGFVVSSDAVKKIAQRQANLRDN